MKKILLAILLVFLHFINGTCQGGYFNFDLHDSIEQSKWISPNGSWVVNYNSLRTQMSSGDGLGTYGVVKRLVYLNEGHSSISFDYSMSSIYSCSTYGLDVFIYPCDGSTVRYASDDGQAWGSSFPYYYCRFNFCHYVVKDGDIHINTNHIVGSGTFNRDFVVPEEGYYYLLFCWHYKGSCSPQVNVSNISLFNPESLMSNFDGNIGNNDWIFGNDGGINSWCIGTAASKSTPNSLYVSNDGGINNLYVNGISSFAYVYHNVVLDTGNWHISYDWRAQGESMGDFMRVFLVPQDFPLDSIGFNLAVLPTSAIPLDGNQPLNVHPTWTHFSSTFNITEGGFTIYKLVYYWINNGNSIGDNPPPAIDNLAINSRKKISVILDNTYHSTYTCNEEYDYMDTAMVLISHDEHYHVTSVRNYQDTISGFWYYNDWVLFKDTTMSSICYMSPLKDTCFVVMDKNYILHVDVAIDTHHVQVNSRLNYGNVSVTNNGQIPYGQVCTVFADTSDTDYRFYTWSNGVTSNPYSFVVTQDTSLTAIYIVPNESHLLHAAPSNITMGQIDITGECIYQDLYQEGNIILTANANYGYHFVQWNDGVTDNPRTINLTKDTSLTAIFAVNQYTLSLSSNDATMGVISGGGTYDYLSQVTISASASSHCHFVQWSDGNSTNPRIVTLTHNMSLTAVFAQDPHYSINVMVNDPTRGSVTGGGIYYAGEYATLTATANDHYYFSSWSDGVTANPYYLTVIENASYTAFFELMNYTVNLTTNDDYMGSVYGSGEYPYGSTANIEAQPFDGFRFIEWSDGNTISSRSLTVLEDISLQARFGDANSEGIDNVDGFQYSIKVYQGRIVVEGIDENRVQIYDVVGRQHFHNDHLQKGVYVVRIDNVITKKVVVL